MGNKQIQPLLAGVQPVQGSYQLSVDVTQNQPQPNSGISNRNSAEIFLVDPVEQIQLKIPLYQIEYIWIDKGVYLDEIYRILHRFNDCLEKFEEFNDVEKFRQKLQKHHGNTILRVITSAALPQDVFRLINRNRYVEKAILFCQNKDIAWGIKQRYTKICQYAETSLEVLEKIGEQSTFKNSILLIVPEDIPVINKYWINFFCLLKHQDRNYAKDQFLQLARYLYPEQHGSINQFQAKYSQEIGEFGRQKFVIEWMFKDSFYWDVVEKLPKVTNDPKKLAYLRGPFKEIYEAIKNNYILIPSQILSNLEAIYIVVQLSQQQKEKISESIDNYMIFNSFVKGFTSQISVENFIKSQTDYKSRNFFTFHVIIPKKGSLFRDLDYGFMIHDLKKIGDENNKHADVVFNIFNYFKVRDFKVNTKSGILIYGGLADTYQKREKIEYRKQLKDKDNELLRVYDIISNESRKIRDQGSALRFSGHIQDSIIHNDSKISQIQSIGNSNNSIVQIDEVNLEKGASLLLKQNYQAALNTYLQIQSEKYGIIAYIRIIGVYIQLNDWEYARKYLKKIHESIDRPKNQWDEPEEYFRGWHYKNWLLMEAQNYIDALSQYKKLKNDILQHYDYKTSVLPFMQEILSNMNKCSEMKMTKPMIKT